MAQATNTTVNQPNNNSNGGFFGGLVNLGQEAYQGGKAFLQSPFFTGNNLFGTPGQSGASQIGNGLAPLLPSSAPSQNTTSGIANSSIPSQTHTLGTANFTSPNDYTQTQGIAGTGGNSGGSSSINTSYQMTPQEASGGAAGIAAYNARIAKMNQGNSGGAGSGTGGTGPTPEQIAANTYSGGKNSSGQTLAGYTPTINAQGQSTDVQSNVNAGGGTKTNFPSIVGGLASTAATSSPQYQEAQKTYNQAAQQLATLQQQVGAQNVAILGGRTGAQEAGGEQGLLQNYLASQEAPLTGQEQAAAAAMAAATGQQGTQQSGLAAAGGLAQPQAANPYGTYTPLNPQTGYIGYGGGSTGSGASAAGGVQTQVQQGATVQNMQGIYQQAQALSSNLSTAIQQAGYNPASGIGPATTFANGVNQWLQTNSGNPQYQNVANLISEVASKYANILQQSGGTPTTVSQVQQQIITGLASGKQIEQVLSSLSTNAQSSIKALQSASETNSATGNTNGSNTNTTSGYSGWGAS